MTTLLVGRPKRSRPTDRVNYKIDSDIRAILSRIADRQGRNEGAQVEQLILFYEAYQQISAAGGVPTLDAINAKVNEIFDELTSAQNGD